VSAEPDGTRAEPTYTGLQELAKRTTAKLLQELGPRNVRHLEDDAVTDILRNPDGTVWINRNGWFKDGGNDLESEFVARALIGTVSGWLKVEVSARSPFLEGELPLDGSRFTASLPPVVESATIAIRKRTKLSRDLNDYVKSGSITPKQAEAFRKRIAAKDNILIAGSQGSGKTTCANAVLREMVETSDPTFERFAILEDTIELQIPPGVNHYAMRTNAAFNIDMDALLRRSLRYSATRFIVGELRGKEAQILLEAWTSGHPGGLTTIHAGTARGALQRFEQLIRKSGQPIDREEIAGAVNLIVVITKVPGGGRIIREIARVVDGSQSGYVTEPISV
jgi:P-type conjugative transfer ATPase TrbB